jgi:hypothetical protein
MVVGVGFEPTNARSGRIYSPHPLATWIPYHAQKRDLQHVNKYTDGKWILGEFENSTVSVVALGQVPLFFEKVK